MFCIKCGAQIEDNARFCGSCGAAQNPPELSPANQTAAYTPAAAQPIKKNNNRLVGIIACAVVAIIVAASAITIFSSTKGTVYGNTPGNIVNLGFAALQGDRIYYCDYYSFSYDNPSGGLYSIKTDDTDRKKLGDYGVSFINVVGDRVYFSGGDCLFSIKVDGTDPKILSNDRSHYINVVSDRIYYSNRSDNGKIYSIKTNGTNRKILSNDHSYYINVVGDRIYYVNMSDGDKIYSIKTNGSDRKQISQ